MEASFCAWDILHTNLIRGIMNGEEEGEHYRATTLHFVKSLLIAPGRAWWLWNPMSQLATKWSKNIFGKINGFHT